MGEGGKGHSKGFVLSRSDSFVAAKEVAAVLKLCTVLESSKSAGGRSCVLIGSPGHVHETVWLRERKLSKEMLHRSLRNKDISVS